MSRDTDIIELLEINYAIRYYQIASNYSATQSALLLLDILLIVKLELSSNVMLCYVRYVIIYVMFVMLLEVRGFAHCYSSKT